MKHILCVVTVEHVFEGRDEDICSVVPFVPLERIVVTWGMRRDMPT